MADCITDTRQNETNTMIAQSDIVHNFVFDLTSEFG